MHQVAGVDAHVAEGRVGELGAWEGHEAALPVRMHEGEHRAAVLVLHGAEQHGDAGAGERRAHRVAERTRSDPPGEHRFRARRPRRERDPEPAAARLRSAGRDHLAAGRGERLHARDDVDHGVAERDDPAGHRRASRASA